MNEKGNPKSEVSQTHAREGLTSESAIKEQVIKRVLQKTKTIELGEYEDDFWNRLSETIKDFREDRSRRVILDEVTYLISDLFVESIEEMGFKVEEVI